MSDDRSGRAPPTAGDKLHDVTRASDPQVLRIVATVESIDDRGGADALISPLRNRLLLLRPPRRLRFSRLLFHPLDPMIVAAGRWQPSGLTLPRTMLAPVSACVRSAMGAAAAEIEDAIAGKTTADTALIERLGRRLWPAAAAVLAQAVPPEDWARTGMTAAHFSDLACRAGAILGQAAALDALCASTLGGLLAPSPDALHAIVRNVEARHEPALGMTLALVMIRLPDAIQALAVPYPGTRSAKRLAALEQAADHLVARMEDDGPELWISAASQRDAVATLRRTAGLLKRLEAMPGKPVRREKCRALRMRLDAACKARFRDGLARDLIEPLLAPHPPAAAHLESAARGLRLLEIGARGLADGRSYDTLLAGAIESLKSPAAAERLALTDRVRLLEIIGGPDEALALLQSGA